MNSKFRGITGLLRNLSFENAFLRLDVYKDTENKSKQ